MKRTPLERKTWLARGKALARKPLERKKDSGLARRSLPRAKPKPPREPVEVLLARQWWEAVTDKGKKPCVKCGSVWRVQAHHASRQQDIRKACKKLGLDPVGWLWETDNGMCCCERCHSRHTTAVERLPRSVLRPQHWAFADRLDIAHLLDRYYPRRP